MELGQLPRHKWEGEQLEHLTPKRSDALVAWSYAAWLPDSTMGLVNAQVDINLQRLWATRVYDYEADCPGATLYAHRTIIPNETPWVVSREIQHIHRVRITPNVHAFRRLMPT